MLSRKSLCRCLLLAAVPATAVLTCARTHGGEFFKIAISTGGRSLYLYGEDVCISVQVSNPTPGPLKYMRQDRFIAGVDVDVYLEGKLLMPTGVGGHPWARPFWVESLVTEMNRDPLTSPYSISTFYGAERKGALDPGTYKVVARLTQGTAEWGLATGTAVSNEIAFTVKDWRAREVSERTFQVPSAKTTVQLLETTEGKYLVSWNTIVRDWGHLKVVPIETLARIRDVLWGATEECCWIVDKEQEQGARKLTIVDRSSSSVKSVMLSPF